ncbi:uncharacterized protein LOC143232901 [Tachypleus tridentatus]|uniref:uncharacterized protein LOC143232901 n=1 Tax=Tachypleus tridentatus TaxID=6853 RepID=UPI003FD368D3
MNGYRSYSNGCQSGVAGVFLVVCFLMNHDFPSVRCATDHNGPLKLKTFLYEVAINGLGINKMQKAFDDNAAVNNCTDPAGKLKEAVGYIAVLDRTVGYIVVSYEAVGYN